MQIGELAAAGLSRDALRPDLARELAQPGFGCPVLKTTYS
jgi:hypothetical protein